MIRFTLMDTMLADVPEPSNMKGMAQVRSSVESQVSLPVSKTTLTVQKPAVTLCGLNRFT